MAPFFGVAALADIGIRFSFSARAGVGVRAKGGDRGEKLVSIFSSLASDLGEKQEQNEVKLVEIKSCCFF